MQSPHSIFTSRVARMLMPHDGHTYFRVLLGLRGGFGLSPSAPLPCSPPPVGGGTAIDQERF